MLVRATNMYKKLKVKDKELGRTPETGEKFEVTKERYNILTKTNEYNAVFVEKVKDNNETEIATKKSRTEKAVKKITKKEK